MWCPRTILFPTDFSEYSRQAFQIACDVATRNEGRVIVLHAHPPATVVGGDLPQAIEYEDEDEARRKLASILPATADVPVQHLFVAGIPGPVIARAIREVHADLVVMGTHGRRGLSRVLMGSVAEEVVRRAECPVLLVKPQAVHAEAKPLGAATPIPSRP